ncbi:PREDICTED: threo-3-hydroxyaspartate ammonia-lyase-like isoform X2 [Vollenhovia emeryi]|uniref:threo-3-hydroxyaspartate ammonia-lyase-like isoform X2 n=1 Tax=Vollenhovia emeryi TaxID=411798 RepID=UPI0005F38D47|nr:PREDICTED: threo-3-hydroxyaspartate ammonia-lyase-like isoform X2 [Vollenhovia emeryi]
MANLDDLERLERERQEIEISLTEFPLNNLLFSYTLVHELSQNEPRNGQYLTTWWVIDKGSDQSKTYKISLQIIESATHQIREHIWTTPYTKIPFLKENNFHIYLREELYQFTQSVKARGVVYSLLQLSDDEKRKGVITISTGNFAYSLCHFGKKFGIPVTVVLPLTARDENIARCHAYENSHITVHVQGNDIVEAHHIALQLAKTKGLVYIDGHDHPNMVIGQATLALDMLAQFIDAEAVILPTAFNNCTSTMGIAMAIKEWNPKVNVIRAYTDIPDTLTHFIRTHTYLSDEIVQCPPRTYTWYERLTDIPQYWINKDVVVNSILVEEAEQVLKNENIIDKNAAIGLAAILSGSLNELKGKRVILPVYGKIDSTHDLITVNGEVPELEETEEEEEEEEEEEDDRRANIELPAFRSVPSRLANLFLIFELLFLYLRLDFGTEPL